LEPGGEAGLPVFSANVGEWLKELAGPFQLEARVELQRQGESTRAALVHHWDRLPESARKWLLEWASESDPDSVLDGIRDALTRRSDELVFPALEAAYRLKDFPADLGILILPLLEHGDELIRRAAVAAYRPAFDWRPFFESEPSVLVRQACIARLMTLESREAIPFALQRLSDSDWRIRAAAADGLLSLGESGIRAAITLLPEACESARIAIARMVVLSENEDLVDEFFRFCPEPGNTEDAA
jgi:HEAT repeat protein